MRDLVLVLVYTNAKGWILWFCRVTSLLSAMKKTVGGPKKAPNPAEAEELNQEEEKAETAEAEKKDDIVYADLDKSAMSEGNATLSVENEKTEYAEIKPN